MNSTQAMLIGAVHELEEKKLLDEQAVCTVKTLILEENHEVIKLLNSYVAHMIDERELCERLQKLSDRMSTYIERPSSPLPRKDSLLEFVNSFAKTYIRDKEEVALLQKLIEDENEFVLSAFDVFESDKDQENLLDTLLRIVGKYKRMGLSKNSVNAAAFYNGNILIQRPDTRGQSKVSAEGKARRTEFPFSSESDSFIPGNDFQAKEEKSEEEEEAEAVNLPSAGVVYVTRGNKKQKEQQKIKEEEEDVEEKKETELTITEFENIGILKEVDHEIAGTLKWALKNKEATIKGAYETYKMTEDAKLLEKTINTICCKLFESALANKMSKEQIKKFNERKRKSDKDIIRALEDFRLSGNLINCVEVLIGLISIETPRVVEELKHHPKPEEKENIMPVPGLFQIKPMQNAKDEANSSDGSNDEANEVEIAGATLSILEEEGKIKKEDTAFLLELFKKGNQEILAAFRDFKTDQDVTKLEMQLMPHIPKKQPPPQEKKPAQKKKKKKYKSFDECIEFFKVLICNKSFD